MKITIDEKVCKKYGLSIEDVLYLFYASCCDNTVEHMDHMLKNEYIVQDRGNCIPTMRYYDLAQEISFESDKEVPSKERCEKLASQMREFFPKGIKSGSAAWKGNIREISLRLQKFFKLYGSNWTDEEILNATQKYVEMHRDDYTYMRILKYFILKTDRNKDEEVSELATILENKDDVDIVDGANAIELF